MSRFASTATTAAYMWEQFDASAAGQASARAGGRVVVVGHSAGCPIAMEMVCQRTAVAGLVLLCPVGVSPEFWCTERNLNFFRFVMSAAPAAVFAPFSWVARQCGPIPPGSRVEFQVARALAFDYARHREILARRLPTRPGFFLLHVFVEDDQVFPVRLQEEVAALVAASPGSASVRLPKGGHSAPLRAKNLCSWMPQLQAFLFDVNRCDNANAAAHPAA